MLENNPARHYAAAMDSVGLINEYLAAPPRGLSVQDVADIIRRNVEHLEIMVGKDYWTDEDLTPFTDAIAAGQ